MGGAAIAGGVLIGVTGGLAAPLVGAGVSTLLGALGMGGTAAGVLASGLAGSSAVCGALFGAYGAKSSMDMAARHTKDVADFAIVPVRETKDTLAVRLCVSGWLDNTEDVTAPWTIFDETEDTYGLQWVSLSYSLFFKQYAHGRVGSGRVEKTRQRPWRSHQIVCDKVCQI